MDSCDGESIGDEDTTEEVFGCGFERINCTSGCESSSDFLCLLVIDTWTLVPGLDDWEQVKNFLQVQE